MKKFMLFAGGLVALLLLLANLGSMVLLGLSVWLLYIVFKKFVRSESIFGKIGWAILGLIIASIAFSNLYAVIGFVAAYALYVIYKNWNKEDDDPVVRVIEDDDPFTNFEREWAEINK